MELFNLEQGLKAVSSAGNVLNCQELTGIQAGLAALKSKAKFSEVFFWGKVFGQKGDYYIAYGLRDTSFEFPAKQFHFALAIDFDFKILERLTEDQGELIAELGVERPFVGEPAAPLKENAAAVDGEDGGDGGDGDKAADPLSSLTEIHRLAWTVQEIDFDTAAVPLGAYALNEDHVVVRSSDFRGLGMTAATSLDQYRHFRPPTSVASCRAMARSDAVFYANFLDSLTEDLPRECWAVRQDPSVVLVTLRSLLWPGYVAYHVPQTTAFGGLYFGHAQKNRDLPFLL